MSGWCFLRASIKAACPDFPVSCSLLVLPTNCLAVVRRIRGHPIAVPTEAAANGWFSALRSSIRIKSKGGHPLSADAQAAIFFQTHGHGHQFWPDRKAAVELQSVYRDAGESNVTIAIAQNQITKGISVPWKPCHAPIIRAGRRSDCSLHVSPSGGDHAGGARELFFARTTLGGDAGVRKHFRVHIFGDLILRMAMVTF